MVLKYWSRVWVPLKSCIASISSLTYPVRDTSWTFSLSMASRWSDPMKKSRVMPNLSLGQIGALGRLGARVIAEIGDQIGGKRPAEELMSPHLAVGFERSAIVKALIEPGERRRSVVVGRVEATEP